jgi:hypothetical protein
MVYGKPLILSERVIGDAKALNVHIDRRDRHAQRLFKGILYVAHDALSYLGDSSAVLDDHIEIDDYLSIPHLNFNAADPSVGL